MVPRLIMKMSPENIAARLRMIAKLVESNKCSEFFVKLEESEIIGWHEDGERQTYIMPTKYFKE